MTSDGYLKVEDILFLPQFKRCTSEQIKDIVSQDLKNRYSLRESGGSLYICANQGHSIPIENLNLVPIRSSEECPQAIHGTFARNIDSIMKNGLSRMTRNHIHFSSEEPSRDRAVSGIRPSCDVLIYVDVEKVLSDGIPLLRSANNVILCPGNENGCLPSKYFTKVYDRRVKDVIY